MALGSVFDHGAGDLCVQANCSFMRTTRVCQRANYACMSESGLRVCICERTPRVYIYMADSACSLVGGLRVYVSKQTPRHYQKMGLGRLNKKNRATIFFFVA